MALYTIPTDTRFATTQPGFWSSLPGPISDVFAIIDNDASEHQEEAGEIIKNSEILLVFQQERRRLVLLKRDSTLQVLLLTFRAQGLQGGRRFETVRIWPILAEGGRGRGGGAAAALEQTLAGLEADRYHVHKVLGLFELEDYVFA